MLKTQLENLREFTRLQMNGHTVRVPSSLLSYRINRMAMGERESQKMNLDN